MSRRQLGILGVALLAVLAFPSAGHASIWDIIWGMSGPQMMGPVFHCEWDLQHEAGDGDIVECRAIDYLVYNNVRSRAVRNVWISLDSAFYFSTGKDSDGNQFDWFENYMVAFEPLLEVRVAELGDLRDQTAPGAVGPDAERRQRAY